MRKAALALAVFVFFTALALPAGGEEAVLPRADRDESYYMLAFNSDIEYWQQCYAGFQRSAAIYGARTEFDGILNANSGEYADLIRSIIVKKPSGLAIAATYSEEIDAAIREAMDAGIPVVTYDADAPASGRLCYLGIDNYAAGATAAAFLAEEMEHTGEIAIIGGNLERGDGQQYERVKGFVDHIESYEPGMRVVAIENGNADALRTAEEALTVLQEHPDVRGLYTTSAQMSSGIATVIEQSGRAGEIKAVGFDTDEATLEAIEEGVLTGTISQGTEAMGFWAFQILFMVHNSLAIDHWQEYEFLPLPTQMDIGVTVVTAENIDLFR